MAHGLRYNIFPVIHTCSYIRRGPCTLPRRMVITSLFVRPRQRKRGNRILEIPCYRFPALLSLSLTPLSCGIQVVELTLKHRLRLRLPPPQMLSLLLLFLLVVRVMVMVMFRPVMISVLLRASREKRALAHGAVERARLPLDGRSVAHKRRPRAIPRRRS